MSVLTNRDRPSAAFCGPCPRDPDNCSGVVRRICECTERLLEQMDELAEGLDSLT